MSKVYKVASGLWLTAYPSLPSLNLPKKCTAADLRKLGEYTDSEAATESKNMGEETIIDKSNNLLGIHIQTIIGSTMGLIMMIMGCAICYLFARRCRRLLKRDLTAVGIAAGGREEAGRAGMEMMGRMMPQPTQPPNFFPNQPMFQPARIYPQLHGEMRQGQMMIGSQGKTAMLAPPPIIASAPQENTGQVVDEIGSSF